MLTISASAVLAASGPEAQAATNAPADAACGSPDGSIQHLVTIENDAEGGFQCLGLVVEGETIKAIRVETHKVVRRRGHADSERVETAEYSASVIESSHGAVLDGVPGHDAIILQGHLSAPSREAELVTSYLYNGFTSEYRNCHIRVERTPSAGWRLVDRNDRTVSRIVVRTREIPLIGMFGIETLEGACS